MTNQEYEQALLNAQQNRINAARKAFQTRDLESTKLAHQALHMENSYSQMTDHHEHHNTTSSDYLKAIVFGGLDGIVTIFAIVAGSVGANLTPLTILIIGLGNLFADAVSMAFGEYVSASAETSFHNMEKEREEWELENCPDDEKQEMVEIYTEKYGFSLQDAQAFVDIGSKYKTFFINHMMVEELGILLEDNSGPTPIKRAFVMFGSFCSFGLIPLAGFIIWEVLLKPEKSDTSTYVGFTVAIVSSLVTLFILGAVKGWFVNQNSLKSGLLMVLNGTIAGAIAFGIGSALENLAH